MTQNTCKQSDRLITITQQDYGIRIHSKVNYKANQSDPDNDRFVFAYTITISNTGDIAAKLLSRHWIITDANCLQQEVIGEGVIGEQPHLKPQESFRYSSATIIETPVGCMQGNYQMLADDGVEFAVPIPVFNLSTPNILH